MLVPWLGARWAGFRNSAFWETARVILSLLAPIKGWKLSLKASENLDEDSREKKCNFAGKSKIPAVVGHPRPIGLTGSVFEEAYGRLPISWFIWIWCRVGAISGERIRNERSLRYLARNRLFLRRLTRFDWWCSRNVPASTWKMPPQLYLG